MLTRRRGGIASIAIVWRSVAVGGLLALACERGDDGPGSSVRTGVGARGEDDAASGPAESFTGGEDMSDAGAWRPNGNSAECRAPRPDAGVAAGWARDPATGDCRPYADRNSAPSGWLRFDLETDCTTACLCSALEGFEGDFEDLLPVSDSIECRCSIENCPSTLEEAEQSLCAVISPTTNVQRFVGCGLVAVADYSSYEWVFEQPSPSGDSVTSASRLVGATRFDDASSCTACSASYWRAGYRFADCDYGPVLECQLCGADPLTTLPPCQ